MSIEDKNLNCKMIVLDTQTYAGNFERQLCAHVTGQTGDCGVGNEMAQVAKKEIKHIQWWEDNISKQETQEGSEFMRPCTIWITEGINNSGKEFKDGQIALPPAYFSVAIFVEAFPPKEILDEMLQRAKIFCQNPATTYEKAKSYIDARTNTDLKLTGYRLLEPHVEKILEEKVTSMNLKKIRF